MLALAVYALVFRQPGGKLTDYDAYALRNFADFYFTRPALVAALVGYALVVRGLFWRDPALILTLTAFSLFFFYKIRIVPEHFWAARRFIPVILPGALLLVAAAALTGVRGRLLLVARDPRADRDRLPRAPRRAVRAGGEAGAWITSSTRASFPRLEKLAGTDRRRRPAHRRIAGRGLRRARPRRCRSPTSTRATCSCSRTPRRTRRRSRRSSTGRAREIPPRPVPRRRRHRPAVVALERRAAGERSLPGAGVRVGEERAIRAASNRRSSTTAFTLFGPPVAPPGADRARRRHQRRPQRHPLPRQGADGGTDVPLVAGAIVRHRQPDRRGRSRRSRSWMNDGGRPAAAPPADVTVLIEGPRARHGAGRRAGSTNTPFRFRPTWPPRRRRPASRSASR